MPCPRSSGEISSRRSGFSLQEKYYFRNHFTGDSPQHSPPHPSTLACQTLSNYSTDGCCLFFQRRFSCRYFLVRPAPPLCFLLCPSCQNILLLGQRNQISRAAAPSLLSLPLVQLGNCSSDSAPPPLVKGRSREVSAGHTKVSDMDDARHGEIRSCPLWISMKTVSHGE